jgi:hypothetical protein
MVYQLKSVEEQLNLDARAGTPVLIVLRFIAATRAARSAYE